MIGRRIFIKRCGLMLLVPHSFERYLGIADNSFGSCGVDPFTKRRMFNWTRGISKIRLSSVYVLDGYALVEVALQNKKGEAKSFYSIDKGNTWTSDPSELAKYTNLGIQGYADRFIGIADGRNPSVLYRTLALSRIEVSINSGARWNAVSPKIDKRNIRWMDLVGTGRHAEGRLYAGVSWDVDGDNYAMCRSDDYGRSFTIVSHNLSYVVESRANPEMLIAVTRPIKHPHHEIVTSSDSGISWQETKADILNEHLFRNVKEGVIRTVAESKGDTIFYNYTPATQIETDPTDIHTYYLLTWTGVYATHDLGASYKLLPLATEFLYGVDAIAVDPVNGRYLYAVVMGSGFYRSPDKGCTWEEIELPTLP
jgi:hypothetical protein